MPQLVVLLGHLHEQVFPLGERTLTIGRDPKSDVALHPESLASRRHAEIARVNGTWHIRDLCSKNGTEVNGRPITEHALRDEDEIVIGDNVFIFEAGEQV
jgi:pSer/pThr/pTyr-binding forkhead associated (FHA) protein